VGKVLKGRSRHEEHQAVLRELVELARSEDVDAVLVAGDLFDSAAPTPDAQGLVMRALLALAEGGRQVVVVAGNHDHPRLLDVYQPVLATLGIAVVGSFRRSGLAFRARSGEDVRVAPLPFLSQRHAVRAAEVATQSADERNRTYATRIGELLATLTEPFAADAVNLVVAHGTLPGGRFGGGERQAQSIFSYYFEATAFPTSTGYAALGHLHRRQSMPGPCPIWYAGSPLAVDFGEEANAPGALLVTLEPGAPAVIREHLLSSPRRLRTVSGTVEQLEALAGDLQGDWLRVVVTEKPRTGLADLVREVLPDALEVQVAPEFQPTGSGPSRTLTGERRSPHELFRGYLAVKGLEEDRDLLDLFDRLLDETTGTG